MEELHQYAPESKLLEKSIFKKQIEDLKAAADEAAKKIDYDTAHDEEIRKAISVVEKFLRKSKRVCYGGQAINTYMPETLKFYNEEYDLPDYDFFTPFADRDVIDLVALLQKAGFTEVNERIGIHKGTRKILVNFIPIADITEVESSLYRTFLRRSTQKNGIHYVDPDVLRMNMYLELSRPAGQVGRWEKVFERLLLLNLAQPMDTCSGKTIKEKKIEPYIRKKILNYVIEQKRVLAGAELGFIYRASAQERLPEMNWILESGGAIIFFSSDIYKDAEKIQTLLGHKKTNRQTERGVEDFLPRRVLIKKGGQTVIMIIEEMACNAFNELEMGGRTLRIASLDTLVYLYILLGIFTKDDDKIGVPLLCLAQRLVELENKIRISPTHTFPLFSIKCSGHQKTYPSLLREKVARIEAQKKRSATRSRKVERRRSGTRKAKHVRI
jgi:hypothetical protein